MMRIGQMIKITPEGLQAYKDYHANPLPGVNEMIKECNIQNYSIYHRGDYLFLTSSMLVMIMRQIWLRWLRTPRHRSGGIL